MNSIIICDIGFNISPFGERGYLLKPEMTTHIPIPKIAECILKANSDQIVELIASDHDLFILSKEGKIPADLLSSLKLEIDQSQKRKYFIPACFELGLDLLDLCLNKSISKEQLTNQICSTEFELAMYGFLPGFLYCSGLRKSLHTARHSKPKIKTASGSIGIGGKYLGVYGIESPGGWNIVARTPLISDPNVLQKIPVLSKIQFLPISVSDFQKISSQSLNIEAYNAL